MKKQVVGGAALGAALASAVLVTVYEGSVRAEGDGAPVTLSAGESAYLVPTGVRRVGTTSAGPAPSSSGEWSPPPPPTLDAQGLAALVHERTTLHLRVRDLERRLESSERIAAGHRTYDLPEDELLRMAERCELRWDMPGLDAHEPTTVGDKDARALELDAAARSEIDRALAAYNQRVVGELRTLYTEVTGDPDPDDLAADSMINEIRDKSHHEDVRRVHQLLAQERAGLAAPPVDTSGRPAVERLYRLLTTAGDALQADIEHRVGAETARAFRDLNGGFGSKNRSRMGCPE